MIDPASGTAYPDTADVLRRLSGTRDPHLRGVSRQTSRLDVRPASAAAGTRADDYVLSFEVYKTPNREIFWIAPERPGVTAADAVMVGDSEENDGAAREVGCGFSMSTCCRRSAPTACCADPRDHGVPV